MIKEKVKTGVTGLDDMLEGGLIPGRSYVVSGTSGTGKTTLAMQFLLEGTRQGERVIYVAIDEPPNEVKSDMDELGWDIGKVQVFDATPDVMNYDKTPVRDVSTERRVVYFRDISGIIRQTSEQKPTDITINTLQELLKQEMRSRAYSRMVIDSLTSLRYFYIRTSEENTTLMSFFRTLADLGVTCLLTVQLPEIAKPDMEAHVARGEIRLHKWFNGRGLVRGITIEKYRGSAHDDKLRLMSITSEGLSVKREKKRREPAPEFIEPEEEEVPPPPSDLEPSEIKSDDASGHPTETPPPPEQSHEPTAQPSKHEGDKT